MEISAYNSHTKYTYQEGIIPQPLPNEQCLLRKNAVGTLEDQSNDFLKFHKIFFSVLNSLLNIATIR